MPTTDRSEQLQAVLVQADEAACLQFFADVTEDERREVSKIAIAAVKRFRKPAQPSDAITAQHVETAQIAALSACTLAELKGLGWRALPNDKSAFQILSTRRPVWLTQFAEWLIAENPRQWPLIRTLVRHGLCERPQHDNYILGMIPALNGFHRSELLASGGRSLLNNLRDDPELLKHEVWQLFQIEGQGELTLAAHDKYLGQKCPDGCWHLCLKELSKTGELSRDRLLDESLEALERGFSQVRVAWFSQFHELLEPTIEERQEREDRYRMLLASPIPPTVTFALDALDQIDKYRPIAAKAMVESLAPVLSAKHKGTAKRAVQWLDRLASREPDCKTMAAHAVTEALTHQAADVQRAALELLITHGSPQDLELRQQIAQAAPSIAASLRPLVSKWLGDEVHQIQPAPRTARSVTSRDGLSDLEKQIAGLPAELSRLAGIPSLITAAKEGRLEITALDFGPLDVPRLNSSAALAPVQDLDEWIDVCAYVLEADEEIDDGERVLEGLSRLCADSPDDGDLSRKLGPLMKRIDKIYRGYCGPFLGMSLRDDVCGVVRAWVSGQVLSAKTKKDDRGNVAYVFPDKDAPVWGGMSDAPALWLLSRRSYELAQRVAQRQARPLLSAATHRGGWLDPITYVERLKTWGELGELPSHNEAILALLRLAPDNRATALERLGKAKGELSEASRYALGGEKPRIGDTAALWVAAARARDPYADDPLVEKRFPGLGPGGGTGAQYQWKFRPETYSYGGKKYHLSRYCINVEPKVPAKVQQDLPSVLMNRMPRYASPGNAAHVRWHACVWPAGRESHLVRGTRLLANNLDWAEAEWGNKTYLEPLLDSDEPLTELARVALCLGLCAKEPGEHTLAADVLAAAIDDGRVDGQRLAPALATLLTTAGIKPARLAKVLGTVAQISALHALVIRLTLENVLATAGGKLADPPKDLHHLLELLLELLAESGTAITHPATREALGRITGSGKAAKAVKSLLAAKVKNDVAESEMEIARAALQGRLKRVRRWMST